MATAKAAISGLVGATVLTAVHQFAIRISPDAPRMDVLGENAIAKGLEAVGQAVPPEDTLFRITLAGDLVSNSVYYALVGLAGRDNSVLAGALPGAAVGLGGVALPRPPRARRWAECENPADEGDDDRMVHGRRDRGGARISVAIPGGLEKRMMVRAGLSTPPGQERRSVFC